MIFYTTRVSFLPRVSKLNVHRNGEKNESEMQVSRALRDEYQSIREVRPKVKRAF